MRLLCHTFPTPAEDLALEEALQLSVEEQLCPNTWRVWQAAAPAIILGTGQEAAREVNLEAAKNDGVAIIRRHSGGGAVVIGPGIINFSAFYVMADLPGSETIKGAMAAVLAPVMRVLASWGLESQMAGLSDLVVLNGGTLRKIGGNAQARKRRSVAVHGTLLADPDWERIARLLPFPSAAPDYRAGREHRAFLSSLRECGAPYDLESFAKGLVLALQSDINKASEPLAQERARAEQLWTEKYNSAEWNFRR
ncbi:MAG TPA: biotin/lipoate A/B protein ligase family protein [Planctomycetota bacterium]|jgi:lipoate-protein ligase A